MGDMRAASTTCVLQAKRERKRTNGKRTETLENGKEREMELGNMIFGNSRGECPVPRTAAFEEPWGRFTEAAGLSWRGYEDKEGAVAENDTFRVLSYDWDAECDCGADERMEAWHEANPHAPSCYQTDLHERMAEYDKTSGYAAADRAAFGSRDEGELLSAFDNEVEHHPGGVVTVVSTPRQDSAMDAWRKAHDARNKFQDSLFKELAAKYGVDPRYGAMVHCTCGKDKRAEAFWTESGGHSEACRLYSRTFYSSRPASGSTGTSTLSATATCRPRSAPRTGDG